MGGFVGIFANLAQPFRRQHVGITDPEIAVSVRFQSSGGSDNHIARHVSSDRSPLANPTIRRDCHSHASQIHTFFAFEPTSDHRSSSSKMGRLRRGERGNKWDNLFFLSWR